MHINKFLQPLIHHGHTCMAHVYMHEYKGIIYQWLIDWLIEYLYFVIADNYRNSYKNNKNTEVYTSIK